VADRFRQKTGVRPDVNTQWPDVRIYAHLTTDTATLYIDTSGEPLFKRGWREDTGEAPLKETLAAAMIAASGWDAGDADGVPLYDPCCGSGTIAIEAAQIACRIAAGSRRRFAFEKAAALPAPCLGSDESTGPGAIEHAPSAPFLAAMWRTAWWTLPSATPSAPAWPMRCSCAAETPCSACRPASSPA
jgi:putative N6-adenine-specific DNA methylase